MQLGVYLTLLIGPTVLVPAPELLSKAIDTVSIQHSEDQRSGFTVTFKIGRDMFTGIVDYLPLLSQMVKVGHRVAIMVVINARPHVLMDGIIRQLQLSPGAEPGTTTLTISGTDISALMELVEAQTPWPAHADFMIVQQILARYAALMTPVVVPPPSDSPRVPTEQVPTTTGNDFQVITNLAQHYGYVFRVRPGPVPGTNIAYWGPKIPTAPPQRALTFRMGAGSNLGGIQFEQSGDTPEMVVGIIQDNNTGAPIPVVGIPAVPTMSLLPSYVGSAPLIRVRLPDTDEEGDPVRSIARATARQAETNGRSVKASGQLDVLRYGSPLVSGTMVGVRGVGLTYDGWWWCSQVSHTITRGSYQQSFQLERGGTISNTPVVIP